MNPAPPDDVHSEAFLHALMRAQLRLSVACAAAFLTVLLGLPAVNYLYPEFMEQRVWGFTLSWFVLGVGFFPAVWIIAWLFIRNSIRLEAAVASNAATPKAEPGSAASARE